MTSKFRLVHYVPDPFTGGRVAVGAMIQSDGRVSFVPAPNLHLAKCIGGDRALSAMNLVLDSLGHCENFNLTSGDLSQLALIDSAREIPQGVSDPSKWVVQLFPSDDTSKSETKKKQPDSKTLGDRFFERWHVNKFVRSRFDYRDLFSKKTPRGSGSAVKHQPTHWVLGSNQVLLMEPVVVGTRSRITNHLRIISESFLAHKQLLTLKKPVFEPTFIAYVFAEGKKGAVSEATEILADARAVVIDTDDRQQRDEFFDIIRTVGNSSPQQSPAN